MQTQPLVQTGSRGMRLDDRDCRAAVPIGGRGQRRAGRAVALVDGVVGGTGLDIIEGNTTTIVSVGTLAIVVGSGVTAVSPSHNTLFAGHLPWPVRWARHRAPKFGRGDADWSIP